NCNRGPEIGQLLQAAVGPFRARRRFGAGMKISVAVGANPRYRSREEGFMASRSSARPPCTGPARKAAAIPIATAAVLSATFAPDSTLAGGNCAGTSTGRVPLIDLPPALYQGFGGGLYPTGATLRPSDHEQAADRFGRLRLLNGAGQPDAVN